MNRTGSRVEQADKALAEPFQHADALKAAQTDSARIHQLMADAAKPEVQERGAGFRSLTEGPDTTGPMGTAMLMTMAAFGQLERDTMIVRTRAGLAAAPANNRHGGRPRKIDDAAAARPKELKGKGISASDIGKMLGVSRRLQPGSESAGRAASRGFECVFSDPLSG